MEGTKNNKPSWRTTAGT